MAKKQSRQDAPRRRGGFFGPRDQTEIIHRGERTDPRAVLATCGAFALVLCIAALCVYGVAALWQDRPGRWFAEHFRGLATAWIVSLGLGALLAAFVLFYEAIDPNWPPPRSAVHTPLMLFPFGKDRGGTDYDVDSYELS